MGNIFWKGYSRDARHATISALSEIIGRHGHVVDFKPFSDLSLALRIEVEDSKIDALYHALAGYLSMDAYKPMDSSPAGERTIYLDVAFIHGHGDLTHDIPAVPG